MFNFGGGGSGLFFWNKEEAENARILIKTARPEEYAYTTFESHIKSVASMCCNTKIDLTG